jgi:selenide,water dikinase
MMRLNRRASEVLVAGGTDVHAVTDITGFGILGHAWEMALQSLTNMHFTFEALPWLPNARRYAEAGCVPGGTGRNARHLQTHVDFGPQLDLSAQYMLFDPQTSGGLFAAIDPSLWPTLANHPDVTFWQIGEVTEAATDPRLTIS